MLRSVTWIAGAALVAAVALAGTGPAAWVAALFVAMAVARVLNTAWVGFGVLYRIRAEDRTWALILAVLLGAAVASTLVGAVLFVAWTWAGAPIGVVAVAWVLAVAGAGTVEMSISTNN